MNKLIKINLNQTVSKSELREQKKNTFQWVVFSIFNLSFLGLIIWASIIISGINSIVEDQENSNKVIRTETSSLTMNTFEPEGQGISVEDVNHLKDFQENRIFWGPKLTALINAVPSDMVITKMRVSSNKSKRKMMMDVYLRHDSELAGVDASEYAKNSSFSRADKLVKDLKNSDFIEHFNTDSNGEPLFSPVKYKDEIKKGNELQKIFFEGELNQYYKKKRRERKK
tara:strand:+ start:8514 stop:9194 length:681 start_codon:yes stop_codon:yes gene_type:complete